MSETTDGNKWEQAVRWLRDQPSQRDLVNAGYYDDPPLAAATRYWESEEWRAIRGLLGHAAGSEVLDVGAGRGISSFAFAKDGYAVTALEPNGSDLVGAAAVRKLASEARLSIHVVQESSERLPFADAVFDIVFGRAVLHHTPDPIAACAEFHRVLRPGGSLVLVREHVISCQSDLPNFLHQHPLHSRYGGENAFLLAEYTDSIRRAGFRLKEVLAPLRSPINYSPRTQKELRVEIACRLGSGISCLARALEAVFELPYVWPLVVGIVERVDHRPGRLYSFVAERP